MRKRVAFKVVRVGMRHTAETMPYSGRTMDRAVARFLRCCHRYFERAKAGSPPPREPAP